MCKNLFHNAGPYAQFRISRNFNLRIQNKLIISTFYEWLKCVVQCFRPERKKKNSKALVLMKDEIEAFLPLAYNSFSIDSLQFQNHVSKQFLSQASNASIHS